jgi:hypothetical protein
MEVIEDLRDAFDEEWKSKLKDVEGVDDLVPDEDHDDRWSGSD